MILIIGLGNPGKKFDHTPHNAGFEVLDFFTKKNGFPDFEFSKKYDSLTSSKDDVMLAKPQTFMNESGKAAATILKNQSNPVLVVVHDDIDLPLGTLKIVKDRGSAGHKGIESIIQSVGNEGLIRFRLGIASNNESAKQVVLKKFNEEEQKILDEVIGKSVEALDFFIKQGLEKTMNKYN